MPLLTLRNYRCIGPEGITLKFDSGNIAFVGPNNSGKSVLTRAVHELKNSLYGILGKDENLAQLNNEGSHISSKFSVIGDENQIFDRFSDRALEIEIDELSGGSGSESREPYIEGIRVRIDRDSRRWKLLGVNIRKEDNSSYDSISNGTNFVVNNQRKLCLNGHLVSTEPLQRFLRSLRNSVYVGPFRNISSSGENSEYYGTEVGKSFILKWKHWKLGPELDKRDRISRVCDDIKKLFRFSSFDANASSDGVEFIVSVNGKSYLIEEWGSGLAQFIFIFGTVAMENPEWIFIDEPELHLHPALQRDFVTSLNQYCSKGLVLSTHSLGLARTTCPSIFSLMKTNNYVVLRPLNETKGFSEFLGEMSFSAYRELGHEAILFVEGVSDVLFFQEFLRKFGADHRVVILPLGGRAMINAKRANQLAEVTRLSGSIYILVDSESPKDGEVPQVRLEFKEVIEGLKLSVHLTKRRCTESYISEEAWGAIKNGNIYPLGAYDEPSQAHKDNSFRAVRYMSQADLEDTDLYEFLEPLLTGE